MAMVNREIEQRNKAGEPDADAPVNERALTLDKVMAPWFAFWEAITVALTQANHADKLGEQLKPPASRRISSCSVKIGGIPGLVSQSGSGA